MNRIGETSHRPWPLPRRPWIMTQTWNDLLFAHWPVPEERLRPLLPQGLTLDTFGGHGWVGVVPFHMSGIRLRGLVPVPNAHRFPEINVRTYVVRDGKPGVYFFSLDATSLLAVVTARRFFHLPYFHAEIALSHSGDEVQYSARRLDQSGVVAAFEAGYGPVGAVSTAKTGTLEYWLTERYCLYSAGRDRTLYRGEIHHQPWPLQPADATIVENSMTLPAGIALPDISPLLHFARRLDVLVWPLERLG